MSSDDGEAENLRRKIQYLEGLITNAKVKKLKDKVPIGKTPLQGLTGTTPFQSSKKHSVDEVHRKEHQRPQSNFGHIPRNDSRKYSWNRYNPEKQTHQHVAAHGIPSTRVHPYSVPPFKGSNGSSYVKTPSSSYGVPPYVNVKNDSEISLDGSDVRASRNDRPNVPESKSSSDLKYTNKLTKDKSKSLFTWTRHSENDNCAKTVQVKPNKLLERTSVIKSVNLEDHVKNKSNSSDVSLKPSSTEIVKTPGTGQSLKIDKSKSDIKTNSPKIDKSNERDTIIDKSNINTSVTLNKHLALHSHILEAQTKLAEWKRSLLEKKQISQSSMISVTDRHVSGLAHLGHRKTAVMYPKHGHFNSRKHPHQYRGRGRPAYRNQIRHHDWTEGYSNPGWKSNYLHGKTHAPYMRGGGYTQRGRRGKTKYGWNGGYMYNIPDYRFSAKHTNYYTRQPIQHGHRLRKYPRISKVYVRRRIQGMKSLKEKVPFNPKMKLDRRKTDVSKKGLKFVVINGMLYKTTQKSLVRASDRHDVSSPSKPGPSSSVKGQPSMMTGAHSRIKFLSTTAMKTVIVRGVKFKVDRDGRNLKRLDTHSNDGTSTHDKVKSTSCVSRVDIGGVTYRQTKPGTLERVTTRKTRVIATRVLNKSVAQVTSKHKKDNRKSARKQQYCMFYNRFGKCNRQEKCPYIHDPDRIAVCTRFLRGTCKVKHCPFSHNVSVEKMPVCSYFLKGVCNKTDCPYPHVNVNKGAELCQDFINGYCALGKKCKQKHTLLCPVFVKTGSCPMGKKCRLQHRKARTHNRGDGQVVDLTRDETIDAESIQTLAPIEDSDTNIPFKERRLPAYISLNIKGCESSTQSNSGAGTSYSQSEESRSVKIRPQL